MNNKNLLKKIRKFIIIMIKIHKNRTINIKKKI